MMDFMFQAFNILCIMYLYISLKYKISFFQYFTSQIRFIQF